MCGLVSILAGLQRHFGEEKWRQKCLLMFLKCVDLSVKEKAVSLSIYIFINLFSSKLESNNSLSTETKDKIPK
jgi:hypothetical protein